MGRETETKLNKPVILVKSESVYSKRLRSSEENVINILPEGNELIKFLD